MSVKEVKENKYKMSVENPNNSELFLKSIEDDAYINISEICNQLQKGNILMQKRLEAQNQKRKKKNNKKVYKKTNIKQVEIIKTQNDSQGDEEEIKIKKQRKEVQKIEVDDNPKAVARQADLLSEDDSINSDDLLNSSSKDDNHYSQASDEDENYAPSSQAKTNKGFDPNSKAMQNLFDEIFQKVKDIQMKLADESLKQIIAEKTKAPYQKIAPFLEGAANQEKTKPKTASKPKKKRRKMQIDDEE